jgi:hypothetical protein
MDGAGKARVVSPHEPLAQKAYLVSIFIFVLLDQFFQIFFDVQKIMRGRRHYISLLDETLFVYFVPVIEKAPGGFGGGTGLAGTYGHIYVLILEFVGLYQLYAAVYAVENFEALGKVVIERIIVRHKEADLFGQRFGFGAEFIEFVIESGQGADHK